MHSRRGRGGRPGLSPLALALLLSVALHLLVLAAALRLPLPVQGAGGTERDRGLSVVLQAQPLRADAVAPPQPSRPRQPVRLASAMRKPLPGQGVLGSRFYAASELQRRPVPVSAPDIRRATHLDAAFGLARMILFIDASGHVVRIEVAQHSGFSARDLATLRALFLATRFFPGYRHGLPVDARITIHLQVAPVASEVRTLSVAPPGPPPGRSSR